MIKSRWTETLGTFRNHLRIFYLRIEAEGGIWSPLVLVDTESSLADNWYTDYHPSVVYGQPSCSETLKKISENSVMI